MCGQIAHHDRLVSGFTRRLELQQALWTGSALLDDGPGPSSAPRSSAGPQGPSVAWLLGHLTWVSDAVIVAVAEQPASLPPEAQRHGQPHWGVTDAAAWRALQQTWEATSRLRREALASLDDDVLSLAPAVAMRADVHGGQSSRGRFLEGHVFHLAYHLGQLGGLRARQGLDWGEVIDAPA